MRVGSPGEGKEGAPDVDVEELRVAKLKEEEQRIEKRHKVSYETSHLTGYVEDFYLSKGTFEEEFHRFRSQGYAADPGGRGVVVSSGMQARVARKGAAERKREARAAKAEREAARETVRELAPKEDA